MPYEGMLRDADGRKPQMHPRVAGEPSKSRVEPSVTVDEQDVRSPLKLSHDCLGGREFPKCEIRGNVGEVDLEFRLDYFLWIQRLRVAADRDSKSSFTVVGHVDRAHTVHLLDRIRF